MRAPSWLMATVLLAAMVSLCPSPAQDAGKERATAIQKQKNNAESKLKSAALKLSFGETDNLLVYSPIADSKAEKLAGILQKSHDLATKTLKIDRDGPWKGKLTVLILGESRQYRDFVLQALKRPPQSRETFSLELKGDSPMLLLGAGLGEKLTDAKIASDGAAAVATAVLNRKVGVGVGAVDFQVPEWLGGSFGRLAYIRSDPTRYGRFRSKVRTLYTQSRGELFKPSTAWEAPPIPDLDVLQMSFVDYLAFGPMADKFVAFATAFKPEENGNVPTPEGAMNSLEWKGEDLANGWKKWVVTGK